MNLTVKQVSSLEKILPSGVQTNETIDKQILLGGESFSYQIAIQSSQIVELNVDVISPFKDNIKLYAVKNIIMDFPVYETTDEDFITKEPGIMPDMLMPLELENNLVRLASETVSVWITVNIPENTKAGEYPVTIKFSSSDDNEAFEIEQTMMLEVIPANLPKQETIFTQWFHADCIADIHNVPIYSEEHWSLIDKYMSLASELGINMILTPVITPPLDTDIGMTRPCTQLVKIEKNGSTYSFDFSLLKRWIDLAQKNNIEYFEISHLFSQWGLSYTPNIKVAENGEETYMFGWHMEAQAPEYREFLSQFLPALIEFFKKENIKEHCWFHISDEPTLECIEAYKYASNLVKPLIDGCPTFDALSDYDFYEKGLVEVPVTATNHIEEFLKNNIPKQWAYYCCGQYENVGNRFFSMPSYRNRILGLQIYKYDIKGFLQWGYNFYNNRRSRHKINPYITSSSNKSFPSGDAYTVYPIINGAAPSLRGVIFKEALNDVEVCRKLESFIGREKVIELIDKTAGMNITFSEYPRNSEFIPELMDEMKNIIKKYI